MQNPTFHHPNSSSRTEGDCHGRRDRDTRDFRLTFSRRHCLNNYNRSKLAGFILGEKGVRKPEPAKQERGKSTYNHFSTFLECERCTCCL